MHRHTTDLVLNLLVPFQRLWTDHDFLSTVMRPVNKNSPGNVTQSETNSSLLNCAKLFQEDNRY